ncbi:hypothetical protein Rruber_00082 [Rhodococcus ruber]
MMLREEMYPDPDDMQVITGLDQLAALVAGNPLLYLRFSRGPAADAADGPTRDRAANLTLPGWSVLPVAPEPWWRRPVEDWVARRIHRYAAGDETDGRFLWLLEGTMVGRGLDQEPLVIDIRPYARLSPKVLWEAERRYRERFEVEPGSGPW